MLNIEELEIERLEAKFGFNKPVIPIRSLYNTLLARKKDANYCCEYLNKYHKKNKVLRALYGSNDSDLIGMTPKNCTIIN